MRTEITEFTDAAVDFTGNEFSKSPGHMAGLGVEWDATDRWTLAGNLRHVGSYHSDDANTGDYKAGSFTLAGLRASYRINDTVRAFAYVNNIFDERAPTSISASRGSGGVVRVANMVEPRTFGIGLGMNF